MCNSARRTGAERALAERTAANAVKILVLAPHAFFQVRGTPIDLDILLSALTQRPRTQIDLLVYGEGADRAYPNLRLHRVPSTRFTRNVKPGFSLRKVLNDVLMFFQAWHLVHRHRFDLIHAGEEAAFMALFFRRVYGIPYVYDLDSSIAQQMVEKLPLLSPLSPVFARMEAAAIRSALATAPVCNALAELCERSGSRRIVTLHDISQLEDPDATSTGWLRRELEAEGELVLYAGNLEVYQGVDLLLESFALAVEERPKLALVIVGGSPKAIEAYERKAAALGIASRTHFLGPCPLEDLHRYLAEADIVVAPRIRGINTPQKVFPYLHSGRAVLVTDLLMHTQILTPDVVMLAPPTPRGFADAILRLASEPGLRSKLGSAGREFVETNHTFPAHQRRVDELYDWVEERISAG